MRGEQRLRALRRRGARDARILGLTPRDLAALPDLEEGEGLLLQLYAEPPPAAAEAG